MNIIYLRSNPVNPDPRVEKEVYSLVSAGHGVSILCWDRTGQLAVESEITIRDIAVSITRWSKVASFGSGLRNIGKVLLFQTFLIRMLIFRRKSFDVVHAADFDTVLAGLFMRFFFKKKLVYDIFDFYVDAFPVPGILKPILRHFDILAINTADAVILSTEARQKQIAGSFPKRLVFIHNTPMETALPNAMLCGTPNWEIIIVYVGILQPGRLLLEAMQVVTQHPTWKLMIAGFGSLEREIKNYSALYRNIVFLGTVTYSRSLELNAAADVLFATYDPSIVNHRFSSPNKLYESMMLSKPIIVCKNTGVDEIVTREMIGLAIDYTSEAFEDAIMRLSGDQASTNRMSIRSRKLYDTEYSWRVMQKRLVDLYDSI